MLEWFFRKMDPWFTLFTLWFFFLTLGFISIDLPFSFAWNTAFMSGLGLLIAAWWVDKLKKHACRAVGPALAACFEPLIHYWNATSLSLFYSYFFGNYSFELAEIANASWRSTQYYYKFFCFFFWSSFLDVVKMFLVALSFILKLDCGLLCLTNAFLCLMI